MKSELGVLRGESARIVAIRAQVEQLLARQTAARRLPPLLILGETGTGKGLLARTIHEAGGRHDGPFVDVNCAAIPETLLEAELFGYERGAFTDARQAKPGLFQTAHGGTLFLDEIGLLPVALQSKLLTVLEDRAVRRLGTTRTEPVDVTLVAATSMDLKRAVADGRFREDLYHRLAVITIELPPLRTRGDDILTLADHFLARACADYGLSARTLTTGARNLLATYRWPGNVRELANVMERVALLSETDQITPTMLGFLTNDPAQASDAVRAVEARDAGTAGSLDAALRARIEAGLRDTGGNIRRAAAALGISRNTLRARMDKYGLRHHDTPPAVSRNAPESAAAAHQLVPMQWERRHLAFLRVRLLPSTTVEASRALELVGEKVQSFGGRLEESSPSGVIAVFGLEPVDNAPSHAALAALAIQKAAAHARVTGGGNVEIVSAIHCADFLVGRQEAAIQVGVDGKAAAWSLLETLVADETSGAIVVSGPVVPFLARRFALERLRDTTWLLLRREEPAAGWRATRFVGRTPELNTLRQVTSRVEQRHGQIVGIVGEAGVGKSRLVHEASQQLKRWLVLSSGGAPYAKNTLYFPLVDLFKSFWHIQDTDTPSEVRERVVRAWPADAGDPDVLRAPILDLLGVLPPNDAFRDLDPRQRRQRTDDAITRVFLAASVAQPLCLIIEDLHWIDSATQEVLDRLVTSIGAARMLVLVNYRPEYEHPWSSKTYYSQMRLDPLAVESTSELLVALLGEDPTLEPLKQRLVKRGNPFFLEETVRTLAETNALVGERGRYRLTQPVQAIQVPTTVQAILAARIDRFASEDKRLLQIAAAIGKDVPFAILHAVADLPDDELERGLDHLQAAEFLLEHRLSSDREYSFKHALMHEAALNTLVRERHALLSSRIADALGRIRPELAQQQPEVLAHHWQEAGDDGLAWRFWCAAGELAARRSASHEAATHFTRATECLRRLGASAASADEEASLYLGLSVALMQAEGYRSEKLWHAIRDARRAARATGSVSLQWHAAVETAPVFYGTGRNREYLDSVKELDSSLPGENEPDLRAAALVTRAIASFNLGVLADADHNLRTALNLVRDVPCTHRVGIGGGDPSIVSHSYAVFVWRCQGRLEGALQAGIDAERIGRSSDNPFDLAWGLLTRCRARLVVGEYAGVMADAEESIAICRQYRFTARLGTLLIVQGVARAQLGELEKGIEECREGLALWRGLGVVFHTPEWATQLADLLMTAGRVPEAVALLDEVDALVSGTDEQAGLAECQRLRGMLAAARGDLTGAERWYHTAITTACGQGALLFGLRATTRLAELLATHGREAEAAKRLGAVYAAFTEGHRAPDLRAAKDLLDRLSIRS
jgi:DNA-binding NtrC family response regulator/tetratricopeptide (TPR) repeat protein